MDQMLRRRGKEARDRAQSAAGGARINSAAWYPALQWLRDLGYKQYEIAEAVQLDESRIREIFRYGNAEGTAVVRGEDRNAVPYENLPADIQEMCDFSAQSFKLFYERFSPHDELSPTHFQWVSEFIDHYNLILNVPPRHNKSTIFSVWIPIWLLARNRDEQIILVSRTSTLAKQWASGIAQELEFNVDLINTFGRFAPERKGDSPWRPGSGQLLVLGRQRTARGAQMSVLARGSQQQILGMEATVVIADDPTDARVAKSDTSREAEYAWFRDEVLTRVQTPDRGGASGRACLIGQRVAYNDLYGQIAAQKYERGPLAGRPLWTKIEHKAVLRWPDEDPLNPEAEVLWPEVWPFDYLMNTYERIGGRTFETMYQQNPLPDDARLVRPEWWEACRDHERLGGIGYREGGVSGGILPISRVLSLDPSPRNYNGLVVADVVYDRERFTAALVHAEHFVGSLHDILGRLTDALDRFRPDYFVMESSAVTKWAEGDPFFVDIKRRTRFLPHSTGRNKHDPELGVESVGNDIELGRVLLPYGDEAGRTMSALFENEANVWPFGDHDDVLMAWWFIKNNFRKFRPRSIEGGDTFDGAPTSRGWSFIKRGRDSEQARVEEYRRHRASTGA